MDEIPEFESEFRRESENSKKADNNTTGKN